MPKQPQKLDGTNAEKKKALKSIVRFAKQFSEATCR
jgi:hypothetical protein